MDGLYKLNEDKSLFSIDSAIVLQIHLGDIFPNVRT